MTVAIRPEDVGNDHSIVWDIGRFKVVFDGEAYFGYDFDRDDDFSAMGTFEAAQQWCLDRVTKS